MIEEYGNRTWTGKSFTINSNYPTPAEDYCSEMATLDYDKYYSVQWPENYGSKSENIDFINNNKLKPKLSQFNLVKNSSYNRYAISKWKHDIKYSKVSDFIQNQWFVIDYDFLLLSNEILLNDDTLLNHDSKINEVNIDINWLEHYNPYIEKKLCLFIVRNDCFYGFYHS